LVLWSIVLVSSKWPLPFVAAKSERRAISQQNPEILVATTQSPNLLYGINHGYSLDKLLRIVAYIMRFKRKSSDATTMVKFERLEQSRKIVLRLIQYNNFSSEIKELKCREVGRGSNLSALTVFLDKNVLIRVGGRLEASELSFDAKHPVLLPYNDPIVKENMHCGAQTLLATSRQRYWAIEAKTIARNVILKCVKCTRAKPKLME